MVVLSKENFVVMDATRDAKLSFHVTISIMVCKMTIIKEMGYYLNAELLKNHTRNSCLFEDNNKSIFDLSVYRDNHAMRCINQTKFSNNGMFPLKNDNINFLDSMIQVFHKTNEMKEIDTLELTEEEIVSITKKAKKQKITKPTPTATTTTATIKTEFIPTGETLQKRHSVSDSTLRMFPKWKQYFFNSQFIPNFRRLFIYRRGT